MEFQQEFNSIEQRRIDKEFTRLKDETYLDSAGTIIYAEGQIDQIAESLKQNLFCNPHTSQKTEHLIDQIRIKILNHFNADSNDYTVIFTSGATASLKIVAESFDFSADESFTYYMDSHTSVLGMREVVQTKNIIPLHKEQLLEMKNEPLIVNSKGLITFPAQCNFNGFKFPLELIQKFQKNPENFVCLDAASFVSTNFLDLTLYKPDYVCLSFYKMFGYPTGLGALIVSNRGAGKLKKRYYGGGTVKIALTRTNWHQKRDPLHERFEDGTISFLSIIALKTCFEFFENLLGADFVNRISRHTFNLGKYLHHNLQNLKHFNNQPVVSFHHDTHFEENKTQGGIVNFSLRHSDGSFVGFAEFASIAALNNIILRTGCFCNPGSCQTHLQLSNDDLLSQFNAGHICGDDNDLIDGAPTGSIRVSFGYMTTKKNIDKLIEVIRSCYQETSNRIVEQPILINRKSLKKSKLKSIRIYPIKSCAAQVINTSWKITNRGLKYDREWLIIDGVSGVSVTQKNTTRMCLIKPSIDEENMTMRLEFPNMPSIEVSLEPLNGTSRDAKICETKVCGESIKGVDCGDDVANWLSSALSTDNLRLIRQSESKERRNGVLSLSNQAQYLLISEPSVKWLMNQVDEWEDSEQDVENILNRFRGNLVIDNLEALSETTFKEIKIGKIDFKVQGPCTRCQMICIDQSSGQKTTEPLRTIGKVFKGKMRFGIYLQHLNGDQLDLACGDIVNF